MRADATLEAQLSRAAEYRTQLRRFLSRTDAVAGRAGPTSQRYDLLLMIGAAGELRVTELCELLQFQQTAVTELVRRSEEAGLIARRSSSEDRRVSLLRLTADGERRPLGAFAELRLTGMRSLRCIAKQIGASWPRVHEPAVEADMRLRLVGQGHLRSEMASPVVATSVKE